VHKGLATALGLALAAAWAGVVWQANRPEGAAATRVRALAVVPAGPVFVLSVDVARLRASGAGQALVGRSVAGLAAKACENVIAQGSDELVVALPAGSDGTRPGLDSLALIVSGTFRGSAVATCAEERVRARGGDPVRTALGSFVSVRARRQPAEVVARDGLLIVSEGAYLRTLVDVADGHRADGSEAERERDLVHAELRRVLGRGAPVIATLVLPSGWPRAVLAEPAAELSPLSAVRSAALRAELGTEIELSGLIVCDASASCEHLVRFLGNARADLGNLLPPDAATLLGRLAFTRKDARIDFSAQLRAEDVAKLAPVAPR
jgi:hypothetical protein